MTGHLYSHHAILSFLERDCSRGVGLGKARCDDRAQAEADVMS